MNSKCRFFTLIELLIVIGIIAILASMLLPTLNKARGKAKSLSCANNLKQIGIGMGMYTQTYDGFLPSYDFQKGDFRFWYVNAANMMDGKISTTSKFVDLKPKIFQCPSAVTPDFGFNGLSYGYNAYLGYFAAYPERKYKITQIRRPSALIMNADGDGDHYYDSHVNFYRTMVGDRHNGGTQITYVDGHVNWKKRYEVSCIGSLPENEPGGGVLGAITPELNKMWGREGWVRR